MGPVYGARPRILHLVLPVPRHAPPNLILAVEAVISATNIWSDPVSIHPSLYLLRTQAY